MRKLVLALLLPGTALAPAAAQVRIVPPNLPGFVTLKGDLHLHTVFSDGAVWRSFRVYEATGDGLDLIAFTDHIDYQGSPNELTRDYTRPHAIATAAASRGKPIVLKGAEISPRTPPYLLRPTWKR